MASFSINEPPVASYQRMVRYVLGSVPNFPLSDSLSPWQGEFLLKQTGLCIEDSGDFLQDRP